MLLINLHAYIKCRILDICLTLCDVESPNLLFLIINNKCFKMHIILMNKHYYLSIISELIYKLTRRVFTRALF